MTSTPHPRLSVAAAVATALMSLCLTPLIEGQRWLLAAWVVLALVAGTGAGLRIVVRWWPVVVLAQLAVLAVLVTVLFVRQEAVYGLLPGPLAISRLNQLMVDGLEVTRQQGPPVTAAQGIVLMAVGGVGLVGLATDLVAVSLRRPALAGLPLLAVYCLPAALLSGGLGWFFFLVAGSGYLVLVAADSGDRVRSWGRVLSSAGRRGMPAAEGLGRGGRRIAAACLAVAALVPSLVPGLGERLIGRHGTGIGTGKGQVVRVVNPILDLRRNLTSTSNQVVLSYRTGSHDPVLLRIVTDSTFDGRSWAPSENPVQGANQVQRGLPQPPGLAADTRVTPDRVDVRIGPLAQTYLPLPYPTSTVDVSGNWLFEPATLNVVAGNRRTTTQGLNYGARYLTVAPTAEQLRAAPPVARDRGEVADLAVPRRGTDAIATLARQIAGDGTGYDQAANLQRYFRSGLFSYSTVAPKSDNPADDGGLASLQDFLARRSGYCVHFASAMTLMARLLGIPARVAVGFLPGSLTPDGRYEVHVRDAHAWPELYFEGVGWVRFEPTPATRVSTVPDYTIPPVSSPTPSASGGSTSAAQPSRGALKRDPLDTGSLAGNGPKGNRLLAAVPWRLVTGLLVVLLVALCPLVAATVTRRRRWRRAQSRADRAEAAWDELRQRLSDLGQRWAAAWTPRALAARVAQEHGLGGTERAALGRLVADLEAARYARPTDQGGRPAAELAADVRTVAAGVAAAVGTRTRRRARWVPASGVEALLAAARRVDLAADQAGRRVNDLGEQARRKVGSRG